MFPGPVVLVDERGAALAAVAAGMPVTLLSPPGAAATIGPLWWRALVDAAAAQATAPIADILDCGNAPGYAMAALRCGCRALVLAPGPAFASVSAAAATLGAAVLAERPPAMTMLDWRRR
jgi:hypothetical protein